MRGGARIALALVVSLLAAACARDKYFEPPPGPRPGEAEKIGKPYQVAGVWYHPRRDLYYDVTGVASWYGREFHGKPTANGETFDMNELTAAHTTLPLPSYVRVTNLENGRSLVLRVNDRGPFVKNRVIDVSRRAAQLLGFEGQGTARVRVQVVRPDGTPYLEPVDESLTPIPARGEDDAIEAAPLEPVAGPESREAAAQEPAQMIPEAGQFFVQVGAYASEANARATAARLDGVGPVLIQPAQVGGDWLYRVRIGAFDLFAEAQRVLAAVQNRGFVDARIFTESAR